MEIAKGIRGFDVRSFEGFMDDVGALRAARLLRAKKLFNTTMLESISGSLYEKYDRSINDPNMNGLTDFCERHFARLNGVYTYNYEEIFEDQYRKRHPARSVKSCHSKHVTPTPMSANVFHLHGFIPIVGSSPDPELILSEETYNALYSDALSWRNRVQIQAFEASICLFVGLSFEDPNMRRLLDYSKSISTKRNRTPIRHVAIIRKNPNPARHLLDAAMFDDMSIDVLFFQDFSEISGLLDKL